MQIIQAIVYMSRWALQFARSSGQNLLVNSSGYEVSGRSGFHTWTLLEPPTRRAEGFSLLNRGVVPRTLDQPSIARKRAKFEVPARPYAVIQWGG
jgi:hypothetical protein